MSTTDLQKLYDGIETIKQQNEEMSTEILLIKTCVSGNELDKHDRGMLGRLEKVEKNQDNFKKYAWMFAGGFAVVVFIFKYILH